MNASLFSVNSPLISHYEHGHFKLAQNYENLEIGQALKKVDGPKILFPTSLTSPRIQNTKLEPDG